MPKINIIENPSELGAGTRGASLGIGALQVVARQIKDDFFGKYERFLVEDQNDMLDFPTAYPFAKRIDGLAEVYQNTVDILDFVIKEGNFPLVLSGDHSCAAGTIAGLKRAYPNKRLGVIWVDAHADLHTPYTTPSGNVHGMPLSVVLGLNNHECATNIPNPNVVDMWEELKLIGGPSPKIKYEDLIFISVRDTESPEDDLMDRYGIKNYSVEEVREKSVAKILDEIKGKFSDCDLVYVSFDVDSMDAVLVSKGTGTPVENGLTPDEAEAFMTGFSAWDKCCCIEIVEINPCLDDKVNYMAEVAFDIMSKCVNTLEKRL